MLGFRCATTLYVLARYCSAVPPRDGGSRSSEGRAGLQRYGFSAGSSPSHRFARPGHGTSRHPCRAGDRFGADSWFRCDGRRVALDGGGDAGRGLCDVGGHRVFPVCLP